LKIQINTAKKKRKQFTQITYEEFNAFTAITMIMSFVVLPEIRHYWSKLYNWSSLKCVTDLMCKNRYLDILGNFSITSRRKHGNKLFKVQPMIDHLKTKFKDCCHYSEHLSIDESMIKFKGISSMKQYLPMKPIKRGFKCWVMCDSKNGYVFDVDIYKGREKGAVPTTSLGERVVLKLISGLEKNYHSIYFDNFFMSIDLVGKITRLNQYCCGTIRSNRRGLPPNLPKDKSMKKGDQFIRYKKNILFIKWMDNRSVHVISNYLNITNNTVERRDKQGKKIKTNCPGLISDYNQYMGGVNHMDQLISMYQRDRKSKRYWLRIYFYLFEMCLLNAFVLFNKDHEDKMVLLDFRNSVYLGFKGKDSNLRRSPRF